MEFSACTGTPDLGHFATAW